MFPERHWSQSEVNKNHEINGTWIWVYLIVDPVEKWAEHVIGTEMFINLLESSHQYPNYYGKKGKEEAP